MNAPAVILFGASRGTGLELARVLRQRQVPVTAMLRGEAGRGELDALGVALVAGDALNPADLTQALAGMPAGYRIVSTLGGSARDGQLVDEIGNIALADAALAEAAREHGPVRLVLITSLGCGEMAPHRSAAAIAAFGSVVDAKTRAEDHLRASGLPWTILRPGGLRSEPATGRGVLSADPEIHGFIHRADLALLTERVLRDPATLHQALAAVDADQCHGPNPLTPFALAP
ncbi:MAG: SDR family NAD(P)-dependent oxidoreductase [Chromatiaceae bacterium]|nr:MAG: SDR family NAD(P)-dependent oxidoreductase [Chromatiaceae bacterium]